VDKTSVDETLQQQARALVISGHWDIAKTLITQYANAQLITALQMNLDESSDRQRVVYIAMHHVLQDCLAWIESVAKPDINTSGDTFIPFAG